VLSFQINKKVIHSHIIKSNIGNINDINNNVENALNILKEATFNRKGDVQNINNAFDVISSNSNHKLLTSNIDQFQGNQQFKVLIMDKG
jgi:hypothetical protein